MFTGIVQEVGRIVSVKPDGLTIGAAKTVAGLELGGSVAVNGVCLTVTSFDDKSFTVGVVPETLRRSNLGRLRANDSVNLERPLAFNGEIGGHLVQGHVDGTGKIVAKAREGTGLNVTFSAPPEVLKYVVEKGFIAIDGTSLTVTAKDEAAFSVQLIGFTREHTILADKNPGDTVNLEADIIGKYVAEYNKPANKGITAAFLREHGFPVN